ncbi:MAG TPA: hypothetical protein VGW38_05735 [Chloroflexota bacterium]|nr:hypothetical protein [Chloroflexota bacterium]
MNRTMLVKEAKASALEWVLEKGRLTPGFVGANFAGSVNSLLDDATFPATSDLDVMLVLENPEDALKPGKFIFRGALLEASYIARDALRSPEAVLGNVHLAGGFRTQSVILDPTGMLTALHEVVSREFARRRWVRRRCESAEEVVRSYGRALSEAVPLHDQVAMTAFAAGVTTFVLLAAGMKNPTVRKRYAAARDLLAAYGMLDFHEPLLALLGCAEMPRERVEHHLKGVAEAFDAAKVAIRTPYRFGSDISDAARPISIDGSWELIERGLHREAVFWLVATHSRCRHIFSTDAPELLSHFDPSFRELLADLGIDSFHDRQLRCREVEAFLPQLWTVAEEILAANPDIRD